MPFPDAELYPSSDLGYPQRGSEWGIPGYWATLYLRLTLITLPIYYSFCLSGCPSVFDADSGFIPVLFFIYLHSAEAFTLGHLEGQFCAVALARNATEQHWNKLPDKLHCTLKMSHFGNLFCVICKQIQCGLVVISLFLNTSLQIKFSMTFDRSARLRSAGITQCWWED